MTRRPVLPGAAELFRRTDAAAATPEVTELPSISATVSSPALRGAAPRRGEPTPAETTAPLTLVPGGAADGDDALAAYRAPAPAPMRPPARPTRGRPTRTERTKHDEKITVYISADELLALESARLTLRAEHGVAADRGRIVREAIAVLLADLGDRGEESVLVRRLTGR
ncbi:hypothetical protein [Geodermatophilus sabuli]|uniref:Cobyrinic acid a,c-diamide synthase n=1 Tax=Geodermatophilus sabuli TaxID=1564158 RepID=A0A285EGB8_9ACTN|nr:hypothetical protein [Geodermatophilus sabuli]MBB3084731.1 hypothetical protein [Geodermatophilus sabuli]SNX97081.1 hypothetical protein SAMN06893097_10630 [Geodermatophilus sabuli]